MAVIVRLLEVKDKGRGLLDVANAWRSGQHPPRAFEVDTGSFAKMPGSSFAYWVSDSVRQIFAELPPLEREDRTGKAGFQTSDDFRFVRAWWEVDLSPTSGRWLPYAKGGSYSPFFVDLHLVVNWGNNGHEAKAWAGSLYGGSHWSRIIKNVDFYLRAGLTWPYRPHRRGGFAMVPPGCVFSNGGMMLFAPSSDLLTLAGLLNSTPYAGLLHLLMPRGTGSDDQTLKYEIGFVTSVPIPDLRPAESDDITGIALNAWRVVRRQSESELNSLAFSMTGLARSTGSGLVDRLEGIDRARSRDSQILGDLGARLDEVAFLTYGIGNRDRVLLSAEFETKGTPALRDLPFGGDAGHEEYVSTFLEWVLGVALGRFDVRLPTGEPQPPPVPDPFDPLPVCSPGMLQNDAGLPATTAPPGYPLELPPHGILVDDPGHYWDVVSRMEAVLELVAGQHAHGWIQEAEVILGRDLRDWLRRYGFERHLKRYSRSRRKAPLFWHLGPKSRGYGLWLYSPAATRDTFYRILNDYVDPRLKGAERRLLELRQHAGPSPTGQQRKDLTSQQSLAQDLRAFREDVALVAPLWRPFRDDGVVLNCAVLWRLFDHHRAWQGECKKKWGELAKGQYDWAAWAMHLWPERVVKTCASDRSIAIAHGLEEALWQEGDDGKWKSRPDVLEQAARLTAERHSTAMQAALDDFIRAG